MSCARGSRQRGWGSNCGLPLGFTCSWRCRCCGDSKEARQWPTIRTPTHYTIGKVEVGESPGDECRLSIGCPAFCFILLGKVGRSESRSHRSLLYSSTCHCPFMSRRVTGRRLYLRSSSWSHLRLLALVCREQKLCSTSLKSRTVNSNEESAWEGTQISKRPGSEMTWQEVKMLGNAFRPSELYEVVSQQMLKTDHRVNGLSTSKQGNCSHFTSLPV